MWRRVAFWEDLHSSSGFPHLSQKFFVVELVGQDRKKSLSFFTLQCHQNLGDVEKAKEWLKKSLELPAKDYDVSLSLDLL